ncbi:uncharacterized protein LOC130116043 isoform X1 [Lampris incognitus]|uniref:uncharacterized protein LOC130116043 isoform X1 n=1 Tax=Lampris incognitus TaxID=2546036 RepID=UPI0024B4A64C|nr:uncharacterized protein LOC130116043 isoform X1 [Lampris incognitus]
MGKCKFASSWLDDSRFAAWLKPVEGNKHEAHCTFCQRNFKLCTMGVRAVDSHMVSEKHKAATKVQEQISALSRVVKADPSENVPVPAATPNPSDNAEAGLTEQSVDLSFDGKALVGPVGSDLTKENLSSVDEMAHKMLLKTPGGGRVREREGEQTMDSDDEDTTFSSHPGTFSLPSSSSSSNPLEPLPDNTLQRSKLLHTYPRSNDDSSRPPPRTASISSGSTPYSLPPGASSVRAQEHVAQLASQSLQQQQASRRLLESMSQSLDSLAQSVQLLVESQQQFVQGSLILQKQTVEILKDSSITAWDILREKLNQGHNAENTLREMFLAERPACTALQKLK